MPNRVLLASDQKYYAAGLRHIGPWRWTIDIADTNFTLLTFGACNFDVDWGDGNTETVDNVNPITFFTKTHNYSSPGTYTVKFTINSGDFRPYYQGNAAGDEIVTLGDTPDGWSFSTSLRSAFWGLDNLTTIGNIDVSAVTDFYQAWFQCTGLTSFPQLNASNGTDFYRAWRGCTGLTSFPLIDVSKGTSFNQAWFGSNGITDFPANFFDSWAGIPDTGCFVDAWNLCYGLTATSIENILNSIDTSGQSAPASPDITLSYNVATGTPNITTAVTNLKARGWTITINFVPQ
jgi:hypothetical protein